MPQSTRGADGGNSTLLIGSTTPQAPEANLRAHERVRRAVTSASGSGLIIIAALVSVEPADVVTTFVTPRSGRDEQRCSLLRDRQRENEESRSRSR